MGILADAFAVAELTGRGIQECKKALRGAGNDLRHMSITEKVQALGWGSVSKALVDKAIDPEIEPQVKDGPEIEPQAAKKKAAKKKKKKQPKKKDPKKKYAEHSDKKNKKGGGFFGFGKSKD